MTERLKGWAYVAKPDPKSKALFKTRLDEMRSELETLYENRANHKGRLTYHDLEIMIDKVIRQCRINTENVVKDEIFLAFNQKIFEFGEEQTLEFDDYYNFLVEWFQNEDLSLLTFKETAKLESPKKGLTPTEILKNELKTSIQVYERMMKIAPDESDLTKVILETLNKQLAKCQKDVQDINNLLKTDRKNIEHELEGIHYLYTFYANQHSKVGHDPTFEQMQGDTQAMDSGSFLRFCQDFLLAGQQNRCDYRVITKSQVLAVFKKHAEYQRDMHIDGFRAALDSLADVYFNEDYDARNPQIGASNKTIDEKRVLLFNYIKIGNHRYLHQRCNNFKKAFTSDHQMEERMPKPIKSNSRPFIPSCASRMTRVQEFQALRQAKEEEEKLIKQKQQSDVARQARRRRETMKKQTLSPRAAQNTMIKLSDFSYNNSADMDFDATELLKVLSEEEANEALFNNEIDYL